LPHPSIAAFTLVRVGTKNVPTLPGWMSRLKALKQHFYEDEPNQRHTEEGEEDGREERFIDWHVCSLT
jgi:hypothetical protein